MVVVVVPVRGVAVAVVQVVDVVAVRHRDMAAALAVRVVVTLVRDVVAGLALVEMPVVSAVQVPIVHIVDVVSVGYGDVAASFAVSVRMAGVFGVRGGHDRVLPERKCLIRRTVAPVYGPSSALTRPSARTCSAQRGPASPTTMWAAPASRYVASRSATASAEPVRGKESAWSSGIP